MNREMHMKVGIATLLIALSLLTSTVSARELLVITNEKRTMEICEAAIRAEHKNLAFKEEDLFDMVQLTYQLIADRPIGGELLQVVIDQRRPFDIQVEIIGEVSKTLIKKNRFVLVLTKHGVVTSVTHSENIGYTMDEALPASGGQ
ncbi:MAG: hypothetical protein ACI9TH_002769 [Kiritimatiellia bacterium]|jgi:hypothetical protein